ncbi:MAG: DnaJ domain-containing protein [Cytophagales bacterium]|nr:DnaJ domain-containing protein [Armatimonadota bacterium]
MAGAVINFYQVLGVTETATLDEIKKRYRTLARQLHPDVNPDDPQAPRKFAEVTEAYKALSDSNSRAVHDFELARVKERQESAARRRASAYPSSPTGRTPPRPAPAAANSTPGTSPATPDSSRLVAQAQAAFVRNRLIEARTLAEQALRLNRRNAQAYEVLGDVFRLQDKVDEAMNMYSMALQINPRNPSVMQRLERMSRAASARGGGGYAPPPPRSYSPSQPLQPPPGGAASGSSVPRPSGPATSSGYSSYRELERRPLGRLLGAVAGYGLAFLTVMYGAFFPGAAPNRFASTVSPLFAPVSTWNTTIVVVMALAGLILGWTMTATLMIRRIEDELLLTGASPGGGRFLPLGAVLIVLSVVNFYAAVLLYLIVSFFNEAITPTMLRVFAAVVAVVATLAVFYEPGQGQVLLFGGNVVFLALLLGWVFGDFFRPDGA